MNQVIGFFLALPFMAHLGKIPHMNDSKKSPTLTKKHLLGASLSSWLFWALAALFYAYEFLHRVSPSVMIPALMEGFHVSRAQLGDLAAFYFYGYALIQIPAGMLVDRYGVRFILTFGCLVIALGSFCLNVTNSMSFACLSRFIIGVGSAFGFVSCLKIISQRFSPHLFPFMVGLTNLFGIIGAIVGGQPLAILLDVINWREIYLLLGLISMVLALIIWAIIRDPKSEVEESESESESNKLISGLLLVVKSPQAWLLALYCMLIVAPITAFAEMWGVEFFQTSYSLQTAQAAGLLKYIFYGIAVGGPTIGLISGRILKLKTWLIICSLITLLSLSSIIYLNTLSFGKLELLLFVYGFASSHMLLCFSIVNKTYPSWAKGAAIGFINMMIMGGSAIFQPIIGKLIDLSISYNELQLYELVSYKQYASALVVLPICIMTATVLTLFIKQQHE